MQLDGGRIASFLRFNKLLVIGQRKLGIDRQKARGAVRVAPRQANCEFDAFVAAWPGDDVLVVLRRYQDLLEQILKLHLAPRAASLDVGQHFLQVADARGERLHLAEPAVDLLEPIGNLLERFAEAQFQRCVQLLVDRRPHLLELLCVVVTQQLKPLFEGRAHRVQTLLVALRQRRQPFVLHVRHVGELILQRLRELAQRRAEFPTCSLGILGRLGSSMAQFRAQLALEPFVLCR